MRVNLLLWMKVTDDRILLISLVFIIRQKSNKVDRKQSKKLRTPQSVSQFVSYKLCSLAIYWDEKNFDDNVKQSMGHLIDCCLSSLRASEREKKGINYVKANNNIN